MPRRNNRKPYTTVRPPVFFSGDGAIPARAECVGCAFAGYGGVCTTSDGACLISRPERREYGNADNQRRADTPGEKR